MVRYRAILAGVMTLVGLVLIPSMSQATMFSGTLFYTNYAGAPNVNKISYSYDDVTTVLTMGASVGIASLPGADGIIFDGAGHLLVGGQGTGLVYKMNTDGTGLDSRASGASSSFHLTLALDGSKVYTSPFGGPLATVPLTPFSAGSTTGISGAESGVTQLVFNPGNGDSFYVTGAPNGFGNFGRIDIPTGATTRLLTGERSIHGVVHDGFTDLLTFFGAGAVGTVDPNAVSDAAIAASFKQRTGINFDFDQGSVDGLGHAFIAGNNQLTFIDYRATGDITSALNTVRIVSGFTFIDDLAPLSGAGSNNGVPEPGTLTMLLGIGLSVAGWRRGRGFHAFPTRTL